MNDNVIGSCFSKRRLPAFTLLMFWNWCVWHSSVTVHIPFPSVSPLLGACYEKASKLKPLCAKILCTWMFMPKWCKYSWILLSVQQRPATALSVILDWQETTGRRLKQPVALSLEKSFVDSKCGGKSERLNCASRRFAFCCFLRCVKRDKERNMRNTCKRQTIHTGAM